MPYIVYAKKGNQLKPKLSNKKRVVVFGTKREAQKCITKARHTLRTKKLKGYRIISRRV